MFVISDYLTIITTQGLQTTLHVKKGGEIKLEGAILQQNYSVVIHNCTFIHNSAQNGGVIYIALEKFRQPLHSAVSSEFINNSVAENGGVFNGCEKNLQPQVIMQYLYKMLLSTEILEALCT